MNGLNKQRIRYSLISFRGVGGHSFSLFYCTRLAAFLRARLTMFWPQLSTYRLISVFSSHSQRERTRRFPKLLNWSPKTMLPQQPKTCCHMRWTQPTDRSRAEGGDGQSLRCHWMGCLCFCAPAEGRQTCSEAAWGGWSAGWMVRWGSCVQRRSPPTASPSRLAPTAVLPPGPPGDVPAGPSYCPALWLSPEDISRHTWSKHFHFWRDTLHLTVLEQNNTIIILF